MRKFTWFWGMGLLLALAACARATPSAFPGGPDPTGFKLTSPAFADGGTIPAESTCDGSDTSPELNWEAPPDGVQSFALIVDDPDAPIGTWVHWVLYHIPADARALPSAYPASETQPDGTTNGKNSWSRLGYGGPCPPNGMHRYVFKLYALDTPLVLDPGATKKELLGAMEGHILALAELVGEYQRP
jgi:Raf kinase inhibitor-like YbhB/YbcL family protein